jgi:protein O-GlcNAc transferase
MEIAVMTIDAMFAAAIDHRGAGRKHEAEALCRRILDLQPRHAEALHLMGLVAADSRRWAEAVQWIGRATEIAPDRAEYWINLGTVLHPLGRLDEAITAYRRAISFRPDVAAGYNNLGNALAATGRFQEAVDFLSKAVALSPNDPDAQFNLGNVLDQMGERDRAIEMLQRSIAVRPDWTPAHNNLGLAFGAAGRTREAIAAFEHAASLSPAEAGILENLGAAHYSLGEMDRAIECFESALKLRPTSSRALNGLANAWKDSGEVTKAVKFYDRAVELNPSDSATDSNRVFALLMHPEYDGPAILREERVWQERHCRGLKAFDSKRLIDRNPDKRLRIGLVSADFCDHVIGRNIYPFVRDRDRNEFELLCYSGVCRPDGLTAWFRSMSDGWRDIARMDDEAAAKMIRDDRIDILLDLSLHTRGNRLLMLARKPAPIQVTFAGYPGGTGLDAMDWRLTDPYLDPPDGKTDGDYSERSFRLKNSFWCYDPEGMSWEESNGKSSSPDVAPLPAMRSGFVTFACLNNHCKVNEQVLELWGKVLRAVRNSRMVMVVPPCSARERAIDVMGVERDRIELVSYQPRRKYLAEFNRIDLGLDTFPYNGHTASLDAMWMGVPVITRVGRTVVGRAGWSQQSNLGITELATHDDEGFVRIAVEWSRDLPRLAELRRALRSRMLASPLCDGKGFTRSIETALRAIWRSQLSSSPSPS